MALLNTTISKIEPAGLVAGENPIILSLSTGTVGSPTAAQSKVMVQQLPDDGLTLTFELTEPSEYTKEFIAKKFPNQDNYFFSSTIEDREGNVLSTGITHSQVAGSLAEAMQKDIILSRYYYINYTGGSNIYLTSKEASSRFSLSGKISSTNNAQVTYQHISTGASQYEGSQISDYSLFAEVWIDEDAQYGEALQIANFNRVTELSLPFSSDNVHRFNASQIAKSFISTPRPDFDVSGGTIIQEYLVPMFFRYGEQYPVVPNETSKKKFQKGLTSFIWVANAALDHVSANDLTSYSASTNNKFFNTSPNPKYSNREQQELLYFLVPKDLDRALTVKADLVYWDGTTSTGNTLYVIHSGATNDGGLYAVNVSHTFHLLPFETSKKIKTAEVYIQAVSSAAVAPEERLFNNSFTNNLTYHNSWEQNGTGATWVWNSGTTSADAMMGTTSGSSTTTFVQWLFTGDMEEWVSDGGGSQSTWAYSTDFGGSVKNTTVDIFGTQLLLYTGLVFPQEPFKIKIGYVMPEISLSDGLVMGFIIRDTGNTQLFNQGIASFGSGSELFKEFVFDASDSNIWENGWSMEVFTTSTNYDPGDELYITSVQILLEEVSGSSVTKTRTLEQRNLAYIADDNLNLEALDYNLSFDVTFGAGTGTDNRLYTSFWDESSLQIGSDILLYSGGTGNATGTYVISNSIAPDIFRVKFWAENANAPDQTISFNEFSIKAVTGTTTASTTIYTESKTYEFPYEEPLNRYGIAFLNKLGVYETFDFIGLKEETLDRTFKEISLPVQANADGSLPAGFKMNSSYDVRVTKRIVVNSGWIDQEHFDWLIQLFGSNNIYSYSDTEVNYLNLDSYKFTKNNQSSEYNVEATFIKTTFEKNVSI